MCKSSVDTSTIECKCEKTVRPVSPPRCEHGYTDFTRCKECQLRDMKIRHAVAPLVDEYWNERGNRTIGHLLFRAYRMGIRHNDEQTELGLKALGQGR